MSVEWLISTCFVFLQARRKQTQLEDSFSSCVKELQLLSESFTVDDVINTAKKRSQASSRESSARSTSRSQQQQQQPSVMLENLRQTLITYKRKLEENTCDVSASV